MQVVFGVACEHDEFAKFHWHDGFESHAAWDVYAKAQFSTQLFAEESHVHITSALHVIASEYLNWHCTTQLAVMGIHMHIGEAVQAVEVEINWHNGPQVIVTGSQRQAAL